MNKVAGILSLAVMSIALGGCHKQGSEQADKERSTVNTEPSFRDLNGNDQLDLYEDESLPIESRVEDLLTRLSLEEKAMMVTGTGMNLEDYTNPDSRVPGAAGYTHILEDLGIRDIVLADGPAGLRIVPERKGDDATYYATAFPVATALASSWDTELLSKVGEAMGEEVLEYGVDVFLAPGLNIHRNPLGGRNFEYYSEDPLISGKMAAAVASGAESKGIGVTLKHYVANNQETNRFLVDTIVSERALREIYLRGFEIAVTDAQPWAIMSSYNLVNGVYTPQSKALLTDVLRGEFGFEGIVMTDWWGGDNAVEKVRAGNDLLMPGEKQEAADIVLAVRAGELDEADVDKNLRRIFQMILKSPSFHNYAYSDKPDLKAHAEIARRAAADGVVLLKNDGQTLPLARDYKNFAVLGNTSYGFIAGGTGSGDVNEAYTVSLVDALRAANFSFDAELEKVYADYIKVETAKSPKTETFLAPVDLIPEMPLSAEQLRAMAKTTDIALLTIGRTSGEFRDRKVKDDFNLSESELTLITNASDAFRAEGKKLIVILNIGNVVETASWRDLADAIVLPWQGGQEAGNAVVDVLTGAVNPSAKLATTFPQSYSDVPSNQNFPGTVTSDEVVVGIGGFAKGNPSRVVYEEGIYVGYRYYDTFNIAPAYEFGFGLSYTDFEYDDVKLGTAAFDGLQTISVTVKNTGDVAGREVVQVYISAPESDLDKPAKELRAFGKTKMLAPGESETLEFSLSPRDLSSFKDSARAWVVEPGTFEVFVGASSRDIRGSGKFTVAEQIDVITDLIDISPAKNPDALHPFN